MLGRTFRAGIPLVCIVAMGGAAQAQPDCAGQARTIANQSVIVLERGGVLAQARLNINIDGSGRAYNWDNLKGLIHLCKEQLLNSIWNMAGHGWDFILLHLH